MSMTTFQCDAYADTLYDYVKGCTRGMILAMRRDDYEVAVEYQHRRRSFAIALQEFDGEDASVYLSRAEAEVQVDMMKEEERR